MRLLMLVTALAYTASAAIQSYEVVVYGGTAGGVAAAVAAARKARRLSCWNRDAIWAV